jgi:hypothetical protein
MFSGDQLQALTDSYATLRYRYTSLAQSYISFGFKTERAREFATHGFLRRVSTMHHCVERVFELIPPDRDIVPEKSSLMDATVCRTGFG